MGTPPAQDSESPSPPGPGEAVVFPIDGAEPNDETPTIVSKNVPSRGSSRNGPSGEGIIAGSLRGRSLAHFELIEPIGVGGMAAVIRARDKQLDRPVALKILPPEMAGDPENVRRFHQEARAAARLDHENIARVFFCGEDQRLHFIAFEFVEGLNLRTLLERRGRLPVPEAVHYMLQIATGLAHAAHRGVVHRDIKPSNIIISPNGRAKLVDMGLARNLGPTEDKALTQSGVTLGTFDYIAPEQAMDPREADVRSDIYAMGCTFYHMLTGQPPVPEGTAARKLHHHQHVAPVDPRQLNPDIPDDVAAILVRMMAKDPKDRYQRAEHLVQHLIQVAQRLGAVADVPDGVLFVDAPLPTPPQKRPLLLAAFAAFALGVLLIVLSFAPGRSEAPRLPRPPLQAHRDVKPPTPRDTTSAQDQKKDPPIEADGPRTVAAEADLRAALDGKSLATHLVLDRTVTLSEGGLAYRGKGDRTLVIESKDPKKPATLRVAPQRGEAKDFWAGLEIDTAGTVAFKDLHFEVEATALLQGDTKDAKKALAPEFLLAGVLVKRARQVTFERCTFSQVGAPLLPLIPRRQLVPVASVAAWNPGEETRDKPQVVFRECYFKRGQAAITLVGTADVSTTNCAFGPHVALFHLRGEENKNLGSHLRLRNVSAMLVNGPAFRLDNAATCELTVQHSLFSCPDQNTSPDQRDPTVLIRQTDARKERSVRYLGRRNCYHNLSAFWVRSARGESLLIDHWDGFKAAVQEKGGADEASSPLTASSPWASPNPLAEKNPHLAFQINPTLPELRQETETRPIGVEKCTWGASYEEGLPQLPTTPTDPIVAKLKPNEKVVDPTTDSPPAGVYRTVAGALHEAKPGDVILIKFTGLVPVSPSLLKVDQRVTLRPFGEHRPVLTLAEKTMDSEAALFTVSHGQLAFEGLEFLLRPDRDDFRGQSVVALTGNGHATFRQCVATLELPDGYLVPLSLVLLTEARDAMKMTAPEGQASPEVRLTQCFVRGEGDLLAVRPSRAFQLEADGCLVALSGSLLNVEAATVEPLTGTAVGEVRLTRTTTYLGEHLANLRSKNGKGLAFTQVTAGRCLFAAAGNRPLIHLEGPDGAEQMKKAFGWAGKGNVYAGFDKLLEQQSAGEMVATLRYYQEEWKRFANEEPEPRFTDARFEVPPPNERALSQGVPDEFRGKSDVRGELKGAGAAVESLPRPGAAERPRPAPESVVPRTGGDEEDEAM